MDFSLTPTQQQKAKEFREFVEREIAPIADQIDSTGRVPLRFIRKASQRGYLASTVPQNYGGSGFDTLTYSLLVEQIAKHSMSLAVPFAIHTSLATGCILFGGNEEQKQKYLPRLTREVVASFAFTEPNAGSDAASMLTEARREGDEFMLNGIKSWVTNGGLADVFIVFAKIAGSEEHQRINAYIVDRHAHGVELVSREDTLGLRGADIRTVRFTDVRIPFTQQLGDNGSGWRIAMRAFDRVRIALASAALGASEHALQLGMNYAAGRDGFGTKLAHKQKIQTYVAECTLEIEALRRLVHYTAWLSDTQQDYSASASMIKYFGARVARDTADKMLQVHGAAGYIESSPIARIYRDVRALRLLGGTDEIQQFNIARDAFKQIGVKIEP